MFQIGQRVNTSEGVGTVAGIGVTFWEGAEVPRIAVRLDGGGYSIVRGNALYGVLAA